MAEHENGRPPTRDELIDALKRCKPYDDAAEALRKCLGILENAGMDREHAARFVEHITNRYALGLDYYPNRNRLLVDATEAGMDRDELVRAADAAGVTDPTKRPLAQRKAAMRTRLSETRSAQRNLTAKYARHLEEELGLAVEIATGWLTPSKQNR